MTDELRENAELIDLTITLITKNISRDVSDKLNSKN